MSFHLIKSLKIEVKIKIKIININQKYRKKEIIYKWYSDNASTNNLVLIKLYKVY